MSKSVEELERMLGRAGDAGDNSAISNIQKRLEAARNVVTEAEGGLPNESPLNGAGAGLSREQRVEKINQLAYEADSALGKTDGGKPSHSEKVQFRRDQFKSGAPLFEEGRNNLDIIKDPETGVVRYAALSSDQMRANEKRNEKRGKLLRSFVPGVASGLIRQVGQRIEAEDEQDEYRRNTQSAIWNQIPKAEQDRVRAALAEKHGWTLGGLDDAAIRRIPARWLKEELDNNPDNEKLLAAISGDEAEVAGSEQWRRALSTVTVGKDARSGVGGFGAETPGGDILGRGKYSGLDETYKEKGLQAPLYAGASQDFQSWLSETERPEGTFGELYEYLIAPAIEDKTGKKPGELLQLAGETAKKVFYTDEQKESVKKPFFPKGMTWRDAASVDFWADPETKMPWNDWDGFVLTVAETLPQLIEGMAAGRFGGRMAARTAGKEFAGQSLQALEKARKTYAVVGGMVTGGLAEGAMIYDEVASEVRHTLDAAPIERWREDPAFQQMVEAGGLSEDQAKQLLTHEAATTAGRVGFVLGTATGAPMSALFGKAAAGTLARGGKPTRVLAGLIGEPLQEGSQEVVEGEISDWQIRKIDPDNPIFSNTNRRMERFGGGAFIALGANVGVAGTLIEPSTPVGIDKEDVEGARAAQKYHDATNERFRLEFKIGNEEYIAETSAMTRLTDMEKLEKLQKREAEIILETAPIMRKHLEDNPSLASSAQLKMLNVLEAKANATLTDIAVARSRKQTKQEMVNEQDEIFKERARIQQAVTDNVMHLEDVNQMIGDITAIQEQEAISQDGYAALVKADYGKWVGANKDKFVIKPRGKRALKLLEAQKADLTKRMNEGYAGDNRRDSLNTLRRDVIDSAGPVEREQMLYVDPLTGVQNRRAYNERVERIDERSGTSGEPTAPIAVAAVDVDGLKWVNDNMGEHAAGDRLLLAVSDALEKQAGVEVYRLGGDEFAVTGASEEALEAAMQSALTELQASPITSGNDQVTPQITWAIDTGYRAADKKAVAVKADRKERGLVLDEDGRPVSYKVRAQRTLFQTQPKMTLTEKAKAADKWATRYNLKPRSRYTVEFNGAVIEHQLFVDEAGKVKLQTKNAPSGIAKFIDVTKMVKAGADAHAVIKQVSLDRGWGDVDVSEIGETSKETFKKILKGLLKTVDPDDITTDAALFQYDTEQYERLGETWYDVKDIIATGDSIELLTPAGAIEGVVSGVSYSQKRPRVSVVVEGRRFTFNPRSNHLITHNTDPADLAWITDDPLIGDPLYGAIPQVIREVEIGHVGTDGYWYADLSTNDYGQIDLGLKYPSSISNYGSDLYADYPEWDARVPYVYKQPEATEEEMEEAESIKNRILAGHTNLPPITLVGSTDQLESVNKDLVRQIRVMPGASLGSVRGFFDEQIPENGVVILVHNIPKHGKGGFEAALIETIFHEVIGHFGIRGIFGNEAEMRAFMHAIVDQFPRHAKQIARTVLRQPGSTDEEYKQLIGEEMVAYITGQMMAGTINLTKPQRTIMQRFYDWVRSWMNKFGWNNAVPVSKDNKYGFWNDEKIQSLILRSQDFVRDGAGWQFKYIDGRHVRLMRDADIFQLATIDAVNNATKTLTRRERKQLEGKYPDGEVPKEIPLFPNEGSPNAFITAMQMAAKPVSEGGTGITRRELELTNLSEKGGFNFFRDSTYSDIKPLTTSGVMGDVPEDWYRGLMPAHLADEFDTLEDIARNPADYVGPDSRGQIVLDAEKRIGEILNTKLDQKKTKITREILTNYLTSDKVISVTVIPSTGHATISRRDSMSRLFGIEYYEAVQRGEREISTEEEQQINDEIAATSNRGYDAGYSPEQNIWFDRKVSASYSSSTPQGANFADDYRVVFIKQTGSGRVGSTVHFHGDVGVLVHVRTGVAEVYPIEGQDLPIALQEAMVGKVSSLIEMQTDWLQGLRSQFKSEDEQSLAKQKSGFNSKTIRSVNAIMGETIIAEFTEFLNGVLVPAANLPSGSLKPELDQFIKDKFSNSVNYRPYSHEIYPDGYEPTDTQIMETTIEFRNQKITELRDRVNEVKDYLRVFTSETTSAIGDLIGTLDARAFEELDKYSVRQVAGALFNDMDRMVDRISAITINTSQREAVEYIKNNVLDDPLYYFNRSLDSDYNDYGHDLRLSIAGAELDKMLTGLFTAMGVADADSKASKIIETMQESGSVVHKIPIARIKDLLRSVERPTANKDVVDVISSVIEAHALSQHGVVTNKLATLVEVSESGESLDITLAGDQEQVDKFGEVIHARIREWILSSAPEQRTAWIRDALNKANTKINTLTRERRSDPDNIEWDDIEREFDMESYSADERNPILDTYEVYSFDEYIEDRIGDAQSDVIQNHIEYIDWGDINGSDGYSLDRESDHYREMLVIDDDGDVDNDEAESWLTEQRQGYRNGLDVEDWVYEEARDSLYSTWSDDPPHLSVGELPTEWDSEGDVTGTVTLVIRQRDHGENTEILIDDDEVDTVSYQRDAQSAMAGYIADYYSEQGIVPPRDSLFGDKTGADSSNTTVKEQELRKKVARLEALSVPNWEMVSQGITENITKIIPDKPLSTNALFEERVMLAKKSNVGVDTPLKKDEIWRTIVLRYMISDAVRRGLPGIIWNPGLATNARGGASFSGIATDRITWSVEKITIRGQEKEFWVINSADMRVPMVVDKGHAVPILGGDVVAHINRQISGSLPLVGEVTKDGELVEKVASAADYLTSSVSNSAQIAVFRRNNNSLVGFYQDQAAADRVIAEQVAVDNVEAPVTTRGGVPAGGVGEIVIKGEVTKAVMGSQIRIIHGTAPRRYSSTFKIPTLGGARQSYEDISPRIWNKELKQYGTYISEIYIKANSVSHAVSYEGARLHPVDSRDALVKERHGSLSVQEVTGENHGWVVYSETDGVLYNDIFTSKAYAEEAVSKFINDNFGARDTGIKAYFIPINAAMREKFSGPVPPFHYDPLKDPILQGAAEKIGYEKVSFLDKLRSMREGWWAEFHQGMFDRFYGIKRALAHAGAEATAAYDAYIQTRLTTSLDTMMKAVLEYGHPTWKDGIMQTEGVGLLEILQPVMHDIRLWGMYMAGKRAKRLLLEGYEGLGANSKARINEAASHFNGETEAERIFQLLVSIDSVTDESQQEGKVTRRNFLKLIGAAGAVASVGLPTGSAIDSVAGKIVLSDLAASKATKKMSRVQRQAARNSADRVGRIVTPSKRFKSPEAARYRWVKELMEKEGVSKEQAERSIDRVINQALRDQRINDAALRKAKAEANKPSPEELKNEKDLTAATQDVKDLIAGGREHTFTPLEIDKMVALNDHYPVFERVAERYAKFNKKVLDFAQAAGVINAETRPIWENADYVPFYRVQDERLVGPFAGGAGIAGQKKPIKRLTGIEARVGDIPHNIMVNISKLIDSSMKNNAALLAVDSLRGSGIISNKPMTHSQELIPLKQVEKLLIDRGMNPNSIPPDALKGFQKMFAVQPPEGPGVISVLRNGKREYYYTDDDLLYRAMTSINKAAWGAWMNIFRAPKRVFTTLITLDPGFMAANFVRDSVSAFVISRDNFIPIAAGIKGFGQALLKDEAMRTMMSAGAAFENGYINQYDPNSTTKLIKRVMRKKGFSRTVMSTPRKLFEGWKALGAASENANRIAVYNAALRAGKSKARAVFEAKDLMDFSMHGDWAAIQFLVQTVPFLGARMQGAHRLGRGFVENPFAFTMKGVLIGMAGLALWFAYRDDDRYKELEDWDKDVYFHWWIGDMHYRLPKPFEVGAIFNTIPERIFEYKYSEENDAGKLLMKRFGFMLGETFAMNPIPHTIKPMTEFGFNYNFFTGRSIVSPYEMDRMAPEEYRYSTSPTMIELARLLPEGLDTVSGKIRSPLHLENLYRGYTGTLGRYFLMAADTLVRHQMDYPNPPTWRTGDRIVSGRFFRGNEPRRTRYEEETYKLLRKTVEIQGSLRFLENTEQPIRFNEIEENWEPYIRVASDLESIRQDISSINKDVMQINLSRDIDPQEKRKLIDKLQEDRNMLFEVGYTLRPGGKNNQLQDDIKAEQIIFLIDKFGVDDDQTVRLEDTNPETFDLVNGIGTLGNRELQSIAKAGGGGK